MFNARLTASFKIVFSINPHLSGACSILEEFFMSNRICQLELSACCKDLLLRIYVPESGIWNRLLYD